MQIRALKLRDRHFPADEVRPAMSGLWDYDDFVGGRHDDWKEHWISFDCLLADDARQTIWCGIASFTGDIFHAFDRKSRQFRSLGYAKVGDRYDAKFHRALEVDSQGMIWAATALYHDLDRQRQAPGGAIVRFDPGSERLDVVARPLPHLYIQSITLDCKRGLLYGQTYTPERFFIYDTGKGTVRDLGGIGSGVGMGQGETLAIDRHGAVWGTCVLGRAWLSNAGPFAHRLWRYHPDEDKLVVLKQGLPCLDPGAGFAKSDGALTGPDGAVYMGTGEGALCRIDPDSHKVELVSKPAPGRRLAGMAVGPDGAIYGVCGREGGANLFRYEVASGKAEFLGPVFDEEARIQAWQIHHVVITSDGVIYAGENDVPQRSSYLWEISGAVAGKAGGKQ